MTTKTATYCVGNYSNAFRVLDDEYAFPLHHKYRELVGDAIHAEIPNEGERATVTITVTVQKETEARGD